MTTYADPGTGVRPRRNPPGGKPPKGRPKGPNAEKPKRRDPLWAKLCLIIGSVVMVLSGAVVVLPRIIGAWVEGDLPTQTLVPPKLLGENIDGSINLLMLGMDERAGNSTEPIRADTIILAHIPASHDKVYLISLPRDAEAPIPDFPKTNFRGYTEKINAAFAYGARDANGKPDNSPAGRSLGAELTMLTVANLAPGIKFNGAAIINFVGFRDVLNAIGGVYMCVDVETRSIHFDNKGKYHTNEVPYSQRRIYKIGCRNFNPQEALDYARQRHFDNGDYTRQRHQQQLLMAIFKKLTSSGTLTDLSKLGELQKAAKGLLTLDLGQTQLADWAWTLKGISAEDIVMIKTNGGKITKGNKAGNEAFSPDSLAMLKAVADDTMAAFVATHQDWITKDTTPNPKSTTK